MPTLPLTRSVGNLFYRVAFPIYRPCYSAFKAYTDRAERQLLERILAPGSVVVDAGANIGIYSRFFARRVGPSGRVHSFEPAPDNFAHLQAAIASWPNVSAHHSAVGARTGEQLLHISRHLNVDHRLYSAAEESPRETVAVAVTSLDDYFPRKTHIDLIKLDVQGYELHALRGAERVLLDNPEIKLLLEFWPYGLRASGASAQELLDFLSHRQFQLTTPDGRAATFTDETSLAGDDPSIYLNLLAARMPSPK